MKTQLSKPARGSARYTEEGREWEGVKLGLPCFLGQFVKDNLVCLDSKLIGLW